MGFTANSAAQQLEMSSSGRSVSTQYLGNRLEFFSCFHKCINLITLSFTETYTANRNLRLAEQESLNNRLFLTT